MASEAKQNEQDLPSTCQDRSENEVSFSKRLNIEAKRTVLAYNFSKSKQKQI